MSFDRAIAETGSGTTRRTSMHVQLVERIRDMIIEGRLVSGERINEVVLAAELEVSRTPLREALKVLAADGIVDLIPNRGALVAKFSPSELEANFQVLAVLEGLAGQLAAKRITENELQEIRRLQSDMNQCFAQNDLHSYFRLNQAIHAAILVAARSGALINAHRSVSARVLASRFSANLSPARWAAALKEHEVILNLLERGQAEELGLVLKNHILRKFDALRTHPREESRQPLRESNEGD